MADINAILFDLGGVLVRTLDYTGREKWEARLGLPKLGADEAVFRSPEAQRATLGQAQPDEIWTAVGTRFNLNAADLAEFERDFWNGDALDLGLLAFIMGLRPRYKVGILTNAWPGMRELLSTRFAPLGDFVDAVIVSAEEGVKKPSPEIFQIALLRLGSPPAETVFIDDFIENVESARARGIQAIHYQNTDQLMAELTALGVAASG